MALVNFEQSVSCTAQSNINNNIVLYMNASIPSDGNISINKSIQDRNLYFANEEECKTDYEEFNDMVENIARDMQ